MASKNTTIKTDSDGKSSISTTTKPADDSTPKKSSNNIIFGWLLVVVIWIIVFVFLFMYIDMNSKLKSCNNTENQTCYMLVGNQNVHTATCGTYAYRCDDVEKGKVRCSSDPAIVVDVDPADGDLCKTDATFNRCKTTSGSI